MSNHNSNIFNYKNVIKETNKKENKNNIQGSKNNYRNNIIYIPKKKSTVSNKEEDKKLNKIYTKNITILYELFLFSQEIQKQLKESEKSNSYFTYLNECYLIKENWFKDNINFGLYNMVYQHLINNQNKIKGKDKDFVVKYLYKEYESYLKHNNINDFPNLNHSKELKIEFKLNNDNTEMIFINKYVIINKDILNSIIGDGFSNKYIKPLKFRINNKEIIIQYNEENSLLIGNVNKDNFFIPKIVVEYCEEEQMKKQFDDFKKTNYYSFEKNLNIKEQKIIDLKDKITNKNIGELFLIDKNKYNHLYNYAEDILTNLYNNDEEPKEIKQKKYYIINNKYMKKLKELFKYDDYINSIKNTNKIIKEKNNNEIIIKKKLSFDIDINQIKIDLEKYDYINLEKENFGEENVYYYTEFEIISENLKECLSYYDLFPKNFECLEVKIQIMGYKLFFYPIISKKFLAFICSKDENNEFITEIIYVFKEEINLVNFIKGNLSYKLSFIDKKCKIIDDKGNYLGIAYKIIKDNTNEIVEEIKVKNDILNLIKIYLFNKDLNNKITLSKTEFNENKKKFKENIILNKCFLINKNQINLYKNYYSYNKLEEEIDKLIEKNEKIKKNSKANLYSQENINIIYKDLQGSKIFEQYKNIDFFPKNKKMFDIKKTKLPNDNKEYYVDFIIINEDILKCLISSKGDIAICKNYIINSGKIIIFFEEENYQVLIGELKSDYFNLNLFINFIDNTELEKFKNKLLEGRLESLIEQIKNNKEKENIFIYEIPNEELNIITSLAIIYVNMERINYRAKESKFKNVNNFFIINQNWIEYLNKFYNYDKILDKLNNYESFKHYLNNFISLEKISSDKNKNVFECKNNDNKLGNSIYNDLDDIIKAIFPNENLDIINKSYKDLEISSLMKKLNGKSGEINYFNNFVIINTIIKQILQNIFRIDSEEKYFISINFLITKNKVYIVYPLNETYKINIGNISEDSFFHTDIIIEVGKENFKERNSIENIIKNKIQNYIDDLYKNDSKQWIIIEDSNKKRIGTAYKIKVNKENGENENHLEEEEEIKEEDDNSNNKNINFIKALYVKRLKIDKEKFKLIKSKYNNNIVGSKEDDKNLKKLILINKTNDKKFNETNIENKMIKLFVILYINYKEIEENIANSIKINGKKQYYLINKDFMKIYKEYYEFDKISNYLYSDENIIDLENNSKEIISLKKNDKIYYEKYISEMVKKIPNDFLSLLETKKIQQNELIKQLAINELNNTFFYIEKNNYKTNNQENLSYYGENEIISAEFLDLLYKLETDKIKELIQKENVELFIGEEKIYLISEKINGNKYPLLTIGYYENRIFKPFLLIYYFDIVDFISLISNIELWSFREFIKIYNIKMNNVSDIKDNNGKKIIGKICKLPQNYEEKNEDINNNDNEDIFLFNRTLKGIDIPKINTESMKLLRLIIYLKTFSYEKKAIIKNNTQKLGYPVNINFIEQIKQMKSYQLIDDFISKNKSVQKIFETDFNKEKDVILQKVTNEFDKQTIDEINSLNERIKIYSDNYNVDYEHIPLNREKHIMAYFFNNCVLLNDEIYNLFILEKKKRFIKLYNNDSIEYLLGDNKIFIFKNKYNYKISILVYKSNDENNLLKLDLILYFNNKTEFFLNQIKENGFKNFGDFLLPGNDSVSPIFDSSNKIIGTAYKYDKEIKDYTDLNINFEIRKIFILYSNYQILKHKLKFSKSMKNNSFNEFYIVNKDWIQEYKNYYNYDMISDHLDKLDQIKNIFDNANYNERINNLMSDRNIALMIKQLPKLIIDNFNESEKYFKTKYNNEKNRLPEISGFDYYDNNQTQKSLFYYNNFELVSSEVYESLFKDINMNIKSNDREVRLLLLQDRIDRDEGKVECLFEKNKIIIKFLNKDSNAGNKFILYIGKINSSYVFEPDWFFLYDYNFYLKDHINYILSMGGFNKFCELFGKKNIHDLIYENKVYGLAVKKLLNEGTIIDKPIKPEPIPNAYISIKDNFLIVPKIGLANIGSTCYMNATLQCFCQIEEFASYFKYDNYVNIVSDQFYAESKNCLTSSFKILIEKLWPDNPSRQKYYSPNEFRKKIADMSPLFENFQANDAKDLVNFIIMTLHEELNKSLFNTYIDNNNNTVNNNQNNPVEVLKEFYQDYVRSFRSKISEIFYAIQETQTKCLNCNNIQYNYQAYFFLVFPLEEVRKYAINNINQKILNNNNDKNYMSIMNSNNNMNNFNNIRNMNNMGIIPYNNTNNINMNFNINFMMNNNAQRNNNIPNNHKYHRRFNSMDSSNVNNMNNINIMMMNNNIGNIMMNCNNYNQGFNNFNTCNDNFNMNNNLNMNNNFNNNFNMQNMSNNSNMPNNYGMNNYSFNNMNFVNNNMNNFYGSNLSNITMNNMFNMGMNNNFSNNMNNFNTNNINNMNSMSNMNNMISINNNNMNNINNINIINNMNNNLNNNINNVKLQKLNNNIVDIKDCFEYNKKVDLFCDSNQIYCNNCHVMANANYSSALLTSPKVLIILLNRGVGIQFNIKLEFPMNLDLSQYIYQNNGNKIYKLIGVITHLGESGEGGHFIAHCLSPIDGQWYTYNDAIVKEINDFQKEVIELGRAYILFYQKT